MGNMISRMGLYDLFARGVTGTIVLCAADLFGIADILGGDMPAWAVLLTGYLCGLVLEELSWVRERLFHSRRHVERKVCAETCYRKYDYDKCRAALLADGKEIIADEPLAHIVMGASLGNACVIFICCKVLGNLFCGPDIFDVLINFYADIVILTVLAVIFYSRAGHYSRRRAERIFDYCITRGYENIGKEPDKFVRLSQKELHRLSVDELVSYRKRERSYLLKTEEGYPGHKMRKFAHPLLLGALCLYHMTKRIRIKTNGSVKKTDRPIIFSVTHIGFYDVEVVLQAIRKHVYMLSADEEKMYRTFDGWLFDANGVIYVDPKDKADKKVAFETAVKYLREGRCLLWYPEGTWNLSPNYVILPIHYGIIEAAVRANALIIPVGLEQYDRKHGIDFIVNIGSAFDPKEHLNGELTKEQKMALAEMLRSDMAGVKMDAWELADRADIAPDYWDEFVARRLAEWPCYTREVIRQREFNPKGFTSCKDAFSHLRDISITPHNAFLARMRYIYMQKIKDRP